MSGLLNSSLNGSASNHPDCTDAIYKYPFSIWCCLPCLSSQWSIQGLYNIHGSFNVPNMTGTLVIHSSGTNRGGMSVVGNAGFSSNTNGVGGSVPGILPTSAALGNRSGVQGLGVSPMLGNISGGNAEEVYSTGHPSRLNLSTNSGSGNLNVQGPNRLMGSMLQQASPQVMSMLGNSYPSAGGPLSQNHIQAVNNLNSWDDE
ncbi:hypothetical protein Leryth_013529 [Lithospermum erythrorhizon]|nr:hypothetical protein Leryth_013529 [Lithospermum erythrorhizon]